jgi:hypothetical protein
VHLAGAASRGERLGRLGAGAGYGLEGYMAKDEASNYVGGKPRARLKVKQEGGLMSSLGH